MSKLNTIRQRLFTSTIVATSFLICAPFSAAYAQSSASTPTTTAPQGGAGAVPTAPTPAAPLAPAAAPTAATVQEVVVTGSILRRKLSDTDAPLTVLTTNDLTQRGITTITDAVQSISANGSSSLPNSFTANGAFAAGAANVSLRGLTSNSTLVLIDGLRTAYYPLADDGTRNFVDLNSIPEVILDKVEVLKDGASSEYGADAIAGVVNVLTKKTYEGFTAKAEGGYTQGGGAGSNNFQALMGHGNLGSDGYNVYLGVEYEHDDALYNRQRSYPFNTSNLSRVCGTSIAGAGTVCDSNGVANGLQYDGSFEGVGATTVPVVRPVIGGVATGNYQLLNPAGGCGGLTPTTVTPAQAALGGATGIGVPTALCQLDATKQYGELIPDDQRFSLSLRFTKTLGANAEAYFTANYYQNRVYSNGSPSSIRAQTTPGQLGETYATNGAPGITLPVTLPNGSLNPNNPFAALNEPARITYLFGDIPNYSVQYDQVYRLAAGIKGSFDLAGKWNYAFDLTGTTNLLANSAHGNIYVANLLTAVNDGTYNFVNPSQNTAAIRNFIAPTDTQNSTSKLFQLEGTLTRDLFNLWGGPVSVGLIGSLRSESIYNPSANPDVAGEPTEKYFGINPFGTIGSRDVEAVAFEVNAPIVKVLSVDFSGRYDNYSTGQSAFSPKVGGRFQPVRYITFRSTYSQGFRIPSFAESNSLPTTGFVTETAPASFLALHNKDGYGTNYSLGETTVGTAGLKPERSSNFTVGFVVDPVRNISLSFDYYYIKKKDVIVANNANLGAAIADYYAGLPEPAGYSIIPSAGVDPNLPNAKTTLGFIQYGFINQDSEVSSGYDFGATAHYNLPYGVKYTTSFDGNYILALNLTTPDGVQHYAGSLGPYNNVAAGGTPKLRANWQNTFSYGPLTASGTLYFTDGLKDEAEDIGGTIGDCVGSAAASGVPFTYLNDPTPIRCNQKTFWDFDTHFSYDVRKYFQVYLDIQNVFNKPAPFDPSAEYGIEAYNTTFDNAGIIGRSFKFGVRATF